MIWTQEREGWMEVQGENAHLETYPFRGGNQGTVIRIREAGTVLGQRMGHWRNGN